MEASRWEGLTVGKSGSCSDGQDLLSKSLIQISVDEPGFVPCLLFGLRPNYRRGSSVKSCLTLCEPMDHSMPGFPVHHQYLELTQTHVHQVSDAIHPSHPLLSPSPPLPPISPSIRYPSRQVAKRSELQLQHQSFQ